ncbi:GFA family protein [Photobacterium sp. 1_MG-2023]|uniref:GFA family protein n=1 Tax=Photobacterium sp. 1_MG-2023 TaxID=3062646 RepID=UPI0026E132E1|nr:GFA family protein [Photobacterium sp. 1_MG-2023]MDO6704859.1 GFA family protein [Photobacterium sp. 1_MG-2023]
MREVTYPIRGACQCGGVTYSLLAPPKMVVACHCKECQKLSTSAFSITAMVDAENLVFEGVMSDWSRPADSGNTSAAKFCPTCGNRIYHYDPNQPNAIKLKPSNLEDTRIIEPTLHVWTSEKQAWYQIPDGVKQFEKQP